LTNRAIFYKVDHAVFAFAAEPLKRLGKKAAAHAGLHILHSG